MEHWRRTEMENNQIKETNCQDWELKAKLGEPETAKWEHIFFGRGSGDYPNKFKFSPKKEAD